MGWFQGKSQAATMFSHTICFMEVSWYQYFTVARDIVHDYSLHQIVGDFPKWGYPFIAGEKFTENPWTKWMMTWGTPMFGNSVNYSIQYHSISFRKLFHIIPYHSVNYSISFQLYSTGFTSRFNLSQLRHFLQSSSWNGSLRPWSHCGKTHV